MKYEITGKVHQVCETQTFASGFAKRTIVLDISRDDAKFKDYAAIEFIKDHTKDLDGYRSGQEVKIGFYVSANESKTQPGRWFPQLRGASIGFVGQASDVPQPADHEPEVASYDAVQDDMPF